MPPFSLQTAAGQEKKGAFKIKSECPCARLSSGKEDDERQKPFITTLRVTKPVRQRLASGRKRVLRLTWRHAGRSVNSESQGRAIEPRKLESRGSLRLGHSGGHADAPYWPGVFGPAGVEEQGVGTVGCPGTWEALLASLRIIPAVGTGVRTPGPRSGVLDRWERTDRRAVGYRQAKETKRGERSTGSRTAP